jgi:hypothetical protein
LIETNGEGRGQWEREGEGEYQAETKALRNLHNLLSPLSTINGSVINLIDPLLLYTLEGERGDSIPGCDARPAEGQDVERERQRETERERE